MLNIIAMTFIKHGAWSEIMMEKYKEMDNSRFFSNENKNAIFKELNYKWKELY